MFYGFIFLIWILCLCNGRQPHQSPIQTVFILLRVTHTHPFQIKSSFAIVLLVPKKYNRKNTFDAFDRIMIPKRLFGVVSELAGFSNESVNQTLDAQLVKIMYPTMCLMVYI